MGDLTKNFKLIRVSTIESGTFGVLLDEDLPFCLTIERPWVNNEKNVSCIPAGRYVCRRVNSPKFGNTFEVTGVPGRSAILFHKGNIMDDSHGCIIVGEQFELLNGKPAVLASGKAFDEFLGRLNASDEFDLEIIGREAL